MMNDLVVNLFNLEKSLGATCLKLLINPAMVVRNYQNGFRSYYPSPGKVLFVALSVAGLHLAFVNHFLLGLTLQEEHKSSQIAFFLFFIPLLATISKLAFLKKVPGYLIHWISTIYLSSAYLILLTILDDLMQWLFHWDAGPLVGVVFLFLFIIGDARVHAHGNRKSIFIHILLEILVLLAAIVLILLLNFWSNPESVHLPM
ncbi:MAG: DUF3667 domain-containing protein [Bacteroidetes bacterium]|nr:DUF3667 domain-containing protein [Bacteroidota bacterium]